MDEDIYKSDGPFTYRPSTEQALAFFQFKDDTDKIIDWTPGQKAIIDTIVNRSSLDGRKRVQIIASTRYGKSMAVAAGVCIRTSVQPEQWALVAGTNEKARIIMEYVVMFSLNNPIIRSQLDPATPLDRLRMKKSQDRLVYRRKGEVRVYSAEATKVNQVSKALMGFGSNNVVEDESALIPDKLQATVMRMLGNQKDNFLVKIGNPFHRNHFLRTWRNGRYYRFFIDYNVALQEGRYSKEFIEEMREEPLFDILYGCHFPQPDAVDEKGWIPLLTEEQIRASFVENGAPFGERRLGVDVAGGGRNESVIVMRGSNYARIIYKTHDGDTMKLAGNAYTLGNDYQVKPSRVFIDKVGVGKGVVDKLRANSPHYVGISGADKPVDERFANLRAEMYWRLRQWLLSGGTLEADEGWLQLARVKYRVQDGTGKLIIMSKQEMLREGIESPDKADALSLTFARPDIVMEGIYGGTTIIGETPVFDPYE